MTDKVYPKFIQDERDFIVDQYEIHECTFEQIMVYTGRSKGYIHKVLKEEGVVREPRGPRDR